MTVIANRQQSMIFLQGSVSSVALDANVAETFVPPQEVGDLYVYQCSVRTGALSGAYAAPGYTPVGVYVSVISPDLLNDVDHIGSTEFLARRSANVILAGTMNPQFPILVRRNERFGVLFPAVGAAGVTATVVIEVRAMRLQYGFA